MYEVKLNKTILNTEDFQNISSYGITIFNKSDIIIEVKDISVNKKFVQSIISKIEENDVSIYHIMDIIEDEIL